MFFFLQRIAMVSIKESGLHLRLKCWLISISSIVQIRVDFIWLMILWKKRNPPRGSIKQLKNWFFSNIFLWSFSIYTPTFRFDQHFPIFFIVVDQTHFSVYLLFFLLQCLQCNGSQDDLDWRIDFKFFYFIWFKKKIYIN